MYDYDSRWDETRTKGEYCPECGEEMDFVSMDSEPGRVTEEYWYCPECDEDYTHFLDTGEWVCD